MSQKIRASSSILKIHFGKNTGEGVQIEPPPPVRVNQYQISGKTPFVFYADLECF